MPNIARFTGEIDGLLQRNATWAKSIASTVPGIFEANAKGQSPQILWIGCSDSRAGEDCLNLLPGEVFVHRNIANVISHGDVSSASVLQFAVTVLKVKHIVVCGHTDCGGIKASLSSTRLGGPIDLWLRQLREVRARYTKELAAVDEKDKVSTMVRLNVSAQLHNLAHNDFVAEAIKSGQIELHGLVYNVGTGLLEEVAIEEDSDVEAFEVK